MYKDVFISHAKEDMEVAEQLYDFLEENGYLPWLDKRKLNAGANWDYEIKKALKESTFIIILLSSISVNKRGYFQREFKYAIEYSETKLIDDIYIIPILLDKCTVPDQLLKFQWIEVNNTKFRENILASLNSQRRKYLSTHSVGIIEGGAELIITNCKLVSPAHYEFDLFLLSKSGQPFSLAFQQYGIIINPEFVNGGLITASISSNSSSLSNPSQIPTRISYGSIYNSLNVAACVSPSYENSSSIDYVLPGTYITRIRIENTHKFGVELPNFKLSKSIGSGRSNTVVAAYIEKTPIIIKLALKVLL